QIYSGIDVVYYGNQSRLEYDFVVSPEADPEKIAIRFDGPEKLRVNAQGDLILSVGNHEIAQPRPVMYQELGGSRRTIEGEYRFLDARTIGFFIGDYDKNLPLVIDPVLSFSTYYGGSGMDAARAVVVGANGAIYVAGETLSALLPLSDGTITNGGFA